jgi:general secretion pathway protein F
MAAFDYIALDKSGHRQKGVIEADNVRQIRQMLREKSLAPVSVQAVKERKKKGYSPGVSKQPLFQRLSLRDLAVITRQLATLVQSGLPVEQALGSLARQSEKPRIRSMLSSVRAQVMEGYSLAESLRAFPGSFSELFTGSVHAGERTGHLGVVLEYLADYAERAQQAGQKMLLALLYPAILTAVSLLIILFLMTSVMPDMIKLFTGTGHALPALTRALIFLSHVLHDYGLLFLLALVFAAAYLRRLLARPGVRQALEKRALRWPIVGPLMLQHNASQFASTLGMLQQSGVPLLQALQIAGAVLRNLYVRSCVQEITTKVSEGISLSAAMDKSGVFPPVLVTMAGSGEASGQLGTMLIRVGAMQQRDLESRIAVLLGLFEPIILLVMGGIVLLLVLAIILPILGLNQMVQ